MIYVECNPDFALIKSFGIPKKNIIHAKNKSEVCKKLKKNGNSKGLVDEDPDSPQPSYMRKLEIKEDLPNHKLKLLINRSNDSNLIVVCPTLEAWILKATKEAKIDIKKYGLPNNAEKLHKIINIRIDKFEKLIKDLKEKSKMLKTLAKLIREK